MLFRDDGSLLPAAVRQRAVRLVMGTPEAAIRIFWTFIVDNDFPRLRAPCARQYRSIAGVIYSKCSQIGPKRSDRAKSDLPNANRRASRARRFLNEVAKIAITATFSHTAAANKNRFHATTSCFFTHARA
jgi:hypothetical protein